MFCYLFMPEEDEEICQSLSSLLYMEGRVVPPMLSRSLHILGSQIIFIPLHFNSERS